MADRPFIRLSLEQFRELVRAYAFTRVINAIHLHHTRRPTQAQFRGLNTIEAIWRHHTGTRGLSDVAAHILIDPDGMIWLGRNWNKPPASAAGNNGNEEKGPFMITLIGDFNLGHDNFEASPDQRGALAEAIAVIQTRCGLPVESVRFHSELSSTDCPGSGVSQQRVLDDVREAIRNGASQPGANAAAMTEEIQRAIAYLQGGPSRLDPMSAEVLEDKSYEEEFAHCASDLTPEADRGFAGMRGATLDQSMLNDLRPYVINLDRGRFSNDGRYKTDKVVVDEIFAKHIPAYLNEWRLTHPGEGRMERPKILFFAHGGLVNEECGLMIAHTLANWWRANGIYPIYFVWETGLWDHLGQALSAAFAELPDIFRARGLMDSISDPLVEKLVHGIGCRVWGSMKESALRASQPEGGAEYVAHKIKELFDKTGEELPKPELHAIGHSAGSIFHSHFIPKALEAGAPAFTSVHLLAPAVRADLFKESLMPRIGKDKGVQKLDIFTMYKQYELDDTCAKVYFKSLLYLIHYALEDERQTPILGLEECLMGDPKLRKAFGLGSCPATQAEVIFSRSKVSSGRSATQSTTHGGFDNDKATMESVLRRILDLNDTEQLPGPPFPQAAMERAIHLWPFKPLPHHRPTPSETVKPPASPAPAPAPPMPSVIIPSGAGSRRALCVGINDYPIKPLSGCVADAEAWAGALQSSGFEIRMLTNGQATYDGIMQGMREMVQSSRPGDVLVFQYSGHGTQVPDVSGDEAGGDSPTQDEAICPFDFNTGRLLIDDDIAAVFADIPDGVNVTCFIDCCHSDTISRFAVGLPAMRGVGDARARFIEAPPELAAAHAQFRRSMRSRGGAVRHRGPSTMREIVYAACMSNELAWESGGHGNFTRRTVPLLPAAAGALTHEEFQARITAAFGASPTQHPSLDCSFESRGRLLLQPLTAPAPAMGGRGAQIFAHNGHNHASVNIIRDRIIQMAEALKQYPE